jgi:hypothetical protein
MGAASEAATAGSLTVATGVPNACWRDIQEMLVVGEEQNLGLVGELVQDEEARRGALVVEVDEKVVRQ